MGLERRLPSQRLHCLPAKHPPHSLLPTPQGSPSSCFPCTQHCGPLPPLEPFPSLSCPAHCCFLLAPCLPCSCPLCVSAVTSGALPAGGPRPPSLWRELLYSAPGRQHPLLNLGSSPRPSETPSTLVPTVWESPTGVRPNCFPYLLGDLRTPKLNTLTTDLVVFRTNLVRLQGPHPGMALS